METTTQTRPAEVVRAVYGCFERRDVEGVAALFAEDVEVTQSEALPWGGVHRGREAALGFLGTLASHIDTNVEIERLVEAGEDVVEVGRTCGRALATGREFEIDEVHVWTVRDGRVAAMRAYVDDAAMLEAIGA